MAKYRIRISTYSGCMGVKDSVRYQNCSSKEEALQLAKEIEEADTANWTTCQVQEGREITVPRTVWKNIK